MASANATPTTGPAAAAAPSGTQPVKLSMWSHNDAAMVKIINDEIKEYKGVKPNVSIDYGASAVQDLINKLHIALAAGTSPDGFDDIDTDFGLDMSKQWLAPVVPEAFGATTQQEVAKQFFDFEVKPTIDPRGNVYGIPMNWAALSLYYNVKAFEAAGLDPKKPPQDWVTLTDYAVKLTQRDAQGNIQKPGFEQNYGPGTEWPIKRLYPMIYQLGGTLVDATGTKATITTPEALKAIQLYTDWTHKDKVSVQNFAPPGITSGTDLFAAGYLPMMLSGSYSFPQYDQMGSKFQFGTDFLVSRFPQWPADQNKKVLAPLWGWQWFVGQPSKAKLEMWSFLNYMISGKWDLVFAQQDGHILAKVADGDTPFYPTSLYPKQALDIFTADYASGAPLPLNVVNWNEAAQKLLEMLERIETGGQTVEQSATQAEQEINDVLQTKAG